MSIIYSTEQSSFLRTKIEAYVCYFNLDTFLRILTSLNCNLLVFILKKIGIHLPNSTLKLQLLKSLS